MRKASFEETLDSQSHDLHDSKSVVVLLVESLIETTYVQIACFAFEVSV